MLKKCLSILLLLFLSVAFLQAEQHLTPKTKQLIAYVKPLMYSSDFVGAQKAVSNYLEDQTLSLEEKFYGYYLQADITKSAGDPKLAISMLTSANELLTEVEQEQQLLYKSLLYGNIAECYFNMLQYENAKQNALLSIHFHKSNDLKSNGHAINHLILGYTHRIEGEYQEALSYYYQANESYKATHNQCDLPLSYIKIADLYLLQEELDKAKYYIDKASFISDSCDIDQYRLLSQLNRINLLEKQGDYKTAFQLLREVEQLRQQITKKSQLKLVSDLQIKYQTTLAKAQNQKLKDTALIVQQNNTFKFLLLTGSVIGLLILVIFGTSLLHIRHKNNTELRKQLELIHQQKKEKEALLKEVHHRVKNNMQVITSLLHLQATNSPEPTANSKDLFQSSQNRINAMALVHETLYQSEQVSSISMFSYIEELAHSLYQSLKKPEQQIHFELSIPAVEIGLDTAIPLGLLLNEILSNSLLHGLSDREEGEIYVHITPLEANHYQLLIGDDGVGLGECQNIFELQSLGLSLTRKLVRQLQGQIENLPEQPGCHYKIKFKAVD